MSTFQPYIENLYPNYIIEEPPRPYELPPVVETTAVEGVRPVESEEDRVDSATPAVPDAFDLSATARALSENNALEQSEREAPEPDPAERIYDPAEAGRIRNNESVRELIQSFANYDNRDAVTRFDAFLDLFTRYSGPALAVDEGNTIANIRARENALYYALGLSNPAELTVAELRDNMMQAIDRWMESVGVFLPGMLNYPSSDGFRFVPLSDRSRESLRSADVMATYERPRIAQYLRELADLTPADFMFYDPTGLGDLPLQQRREFLAWMDRQLREARITQRAAELRYEFENNRLVLEELDLEEEQDLLERLDEIANTANDYYSILKDSVKQYGPGIVSEALT